MSTKRPPWWPTAEQKRHADAGCAHPDECKVEPKREQSDSRTPEPKAPPKAMQQRARAERDRRKACHGDWTPCNKHLSGGR